VPTLKKRFAKLSQKGTEYLTQIPLRNQSATFASKFPPRHAGCYPSDLIGKKPKVLRSDNNKDAFYHSMWNELISEGCWNGEIWNRRKSGEIYPQWLSVTCMKDETGATTHYVGIFHDITSIKTNERRLGYQVTHDPLTGLPNRKLLGDHLVKAIAQTNSNQTRLAVMFLDLDNFKNVNDSRGHQFGNLLLKDVAQKLIQCCRDGDTVSRFGGDEFVILLPTIQDTEPAAVREHPKCSGQGRVPGVLPAENKHPDRSHCGNESAGEVAT